jgi:hypothetical protein
VRPGDKGAGSRKNWFFRGVGVVDMNWWESESRFSEGVSSNVDAVRGVCSGILSEGAAIRWYILFGCVRQSMPVGVRKK